MWNAARSLAQLRATINAELTAGSGLVARWGMSEGSGSAVADSIAVAANGTITGSGATRVSGAPFDLAFDTTPPAAPSGLGATAGDGSVELAWDAGTESDLAGYNVYRTTTSPVSAGTPLNASPLASPAYTDPTATNGTTYHYAVTALDGAGNESALSTEASATPVAPPGANGLALGSSGAHVALGDPAKLDLRPVHHRDLVQAQRHRRGQHQWHRRHRQLRAARDPRWPAGRRIERRRQLAARHRRRHRRAGRRLRGHGDRRQPPGPRQHPDHRHRLAPCRRHL